MPALWISMLGLMGLLALAVLMLPAARRADFPYTVLLAGAGMALGFLQQGALHLELLAPLGDFLTALSNFKITSEAVFFVFLPALIFEAALAMDIRRLLADIAPILLLAIVGLLLSTLLIGAALHGATAVPLLVCLLVGAICSATDPVAVVAIFKEVGAPKRLSILVEGESLFNDATAIVLFTLLTAMLLGAQDATLAGASWEFVRVFLGGVVSGFIAGHLLCWLMARFRQLVLVTITLTLCMAYLSFIVSEHYLHLSGVMTVVTLALVTGSLGRSQLAPRHWFDLEHLWEQIGFWANSIIFILVGMAVPRLMAEVSTLELIGLAVLIVSAFVARVLITFGLLSGLSALGLGRPVSPQYKAVMCWGGLRGAVSLALALAIAENATLAPDIRHFVVVLVCGFVLFTLFVNATTTRWIIHWLGLGKPSAVEQTLRQRAVELALVRIADEIDAIGLRQGANLEVLAEVVNRYREQSKAFHGLAATSANPSDGDISTHQWQRAGLAMLGAMERNHYFRQFSAGLLPPQIFRNLISQVDDLTDALKSRGIEGYQLQSETHLGFDRLMRLTMYLQFNFRIGRPLARRLAERFAQLHAQQYALQEMLETSLQTLVPLLGAPLCAQLEPLIAARLEQVRKALQALSRQYPEYAQRLNHSQLTQSAMWREARAYQSLYADGVIGPDMFRTLTDAIEKNHALLARLPPLDLAMEPAQLIRKLDLLQRCNEEQIRALCALLHPRLTLPNEQIIIEGTLGDAMFFIASGSVEVFHADQHYHLGSGDFFGEIALLKQVPRVADVISSSYCKLLVLYRSDFQAFLAQYPELRPHLEAVASARLNRLN